MTYLPYATGALDIRETATGHLMRHIPAGDPISLAGISHATVAPCTCPPGPPAVSPPERTQP